MKFKILDIFAGAGGFSYGFEMNKNFKSVLALDLNSDAIETYKLNHKNSLAIVGDITNKKVKNYIIKKSKDLKVNIIIGGPPCQGFSMKGKKLGIKDPRNFLFLEYVELVKKIKPKVFVLENVKFMQSTSNGFFMKEAIKLFSDLGYIITSGIINAANFGIPQKRERAFIIGSLDVKIKLPKPTSKNIVTIYDAISDLCYLNSGEKANDYRIKPNSNYQIIMRNSSTTLQWHKATNHSNLAITKMKYIPEKGDKTFLPKKYQTNQKFKTTWSRLHWDKVSPTIDTRFDTPSNGQNIHPILDRAITPREAARIQSFPDSFHFFGKKVQVCRQIGNAVPPLLGRVIANTIYNSYNVKLKALSGNKYTIYNEDTYKINLNFLEEYDALITDPPYNISKKNNFATMSSGKRHGINFGQWDVDFDVTSWIDKFYYKLKDGGNIIIFCSFLYISHIADKLISLGAEIKDLIKWIKKNPMPRNVERRYVSDTEIAIWAIKPGKWTFNKGNCKYRRAQFSSPTVLGKERTIHSTQKSLKLMEELIKIHTNSQDLILDPFMGSGTTGVAALKLGRKFIGIEKEKNFFDISLNRIKKYD